MLFYVYTFNKLTSSSLKRMYTYARLCTTTHLTPKTTTSTLIKAKVPPRKIVTKEERIILRTLRKKRAATQLFQANGTKVESSSSGFITTMATANTTKRPYDPRIVYGLCFGTPLVLLTWGFYDKKSPPACLASMIGLSKQIENVAEHFNKPSRTKLIPDWSHMTNVPHDMSPPLTLVLDLENTLVNAKWDRKNGWRHAKRPGVDKFLAEMAQYYEIVLYSPSIDAVANPVVESLDKSGCIMHRLYRDACYYKNGVYMKDLSSLNRPINKIILLDDDEAAAQLNPSNLIKIKPYHNPRDREDNTLERITPFLIEVARENYDVPQLMQQFNGMDADEIADELEKRVNVMKESRENRTKRGLGAYSYTYLKRQVLPNPEMTPISPKEKSYRPIQQLTAKEVAGLSQDFDPNANKGIRGWLNQRHKDQEEQNIRKMEKWSEVMMKKKMEKKNTEV